MQSKIISLIVMEKKFSIGAAIASKMLKETD